MIHSQTFAEASAKAYRQPPREEPEEIDAPIPEVWTPEHVARRLVEAFRIDRRLPRIERPKAPGSAHPQIEYTEEEREAWEVIPLDMARIAPSLEEIETMDACFAWLAMVSRVDLDAHFALKNWARLKAENSSIRKFCRQHGIGHVTLIHRKNRATAKIVGKLVENGEAVF